MCTSNWPVFVGCDNYMLKSALASPHSSHSLINDQISIAMETREHLESQRQNLRRMHGRFNDMAHRFPVINSLVQRITIRKRRDSLILGTVIAVCTILTILYLIH